MSSVLIMFLLLALFMAASLFLANCAQARRHREVMAICQELRAQLATLTEGKRAPSSERAPEKNAIGSPDTALLGEASLKPNEGQNAGQEAGEGAPCAMRDLETAPQGNNQALDDPRKHPLLHLGLAPRRNQAR